MSRPAFGFEGPPMVRHLLKIIAAGFCLSVIFFAACKTDVAVAGDKTTTQTESPSITDVGDAPRFFSYKIVNAYPHDRQVFTQGLVVEGNVLYESAGKYGKSSLRKVDLPTGKVLQIEPLSDKLFGEGLTIHNNRLIQLTWKSNIGLVYDKDTFTLMEKFYYPTEGWGLTHDGSRLIMSNGTSVLYLLDPDSFKKVGRIHVRGRAGAVEGLNELEFVNGKILANVWNTDKIVSIEPKSGRVTGIIDLRGLLTPADRKQKADVLNGIAYDPQKKRLFVTGKYWPKIFEIRLISKTD